VVRISWPQRQGRQLVIPHDRLRAALLAGLDEPKSPNLMTKAIELKEE
jgi:hypothetical protein